MQLLRESADRIWRFFHDWSSDSTNWLIPIRYGKTALSISRLSPTNLGMLLNARIAAVHMGLAVGGICFRYAADAGPSGSNCPNTAAISVTGTTSHAETSAAAVCLDRRQRQSGRESVDVEAGRTVLCRRVPREARTDEGTGEGTCEHRRDLRPPGARHGLSVPVPTTQEVALRGVRRDHGTSLIPRATICWRPKRGSPVLSPSPKVISRRNRGSGWAGRIRAGRGRAGVAFLERHDVRIPHAVAVDAPLSRIPSSIAV